MATARPFALIRNLGILAVAVLLICTDLVTADAGVLIASKEPGWPQWRGPRRDGICDEKGLLQTWPEGGPKQLWNACEIGFGYSAPIITGGTLFITGDIGNELHVLAFTLDGKLKWQAKNGESWQGSYPGARASCAFSDGCVYNLNAHGRVVCLDAQTGKELWAVNMLERFEGKNTTWAVCECLLIDGNKVIVTPGGNKGVLAALDKKTGQTIWASSPLVYEAIDGDASAQPKQVVDGISHSSPILFELGGRRHIVACSMHHIFGVDAETGQLLWQRPIPTKYNVLGITPVLYKDAVFMTGPDSKGGKLFRLRVEGSKVQAEEVWSATLDTCHGGVLCVGDYLYGAWYRPPNGWGCVDGATGKTLYQSKTLAMGSAIWADGRFYCLSQEGVMALVQADAKGFNIVSQFRLIDDKKDDVWAHPVILDGRLYLRYHEKLFCYDISARN